jgi:hypothetical protein
LLQGSILLIIAVCTAFLASPYLVETKAFACSCAQRTPAELYNSAPAVLVTYDRKLRDVARLEGIMACSPDNFRFYQ